MVFFVPQDDNSNYRFSLIEITLEQKDGSAKVQRTFSNPHRYSYYLGKGISYHTPNKYLNEAGRVVNIEDLRGMIFQAEECMQPGQKLLGMLSAILEGFL